MKKGMWICLGLDALLSAGLSIFFLSTGSILFYLFTNDAEVIANGLQVLKAIAPYYVLVALYEMTGNALRGMNDVVITSIINILGLCGIRIIWIMYLPNNSTLYHIILSCLVSWVLTAIAMMAYYLLHTKKFNVVV